MDVYKPFLSSAIWFLNAFIVYKTLVHNTAYDHKDKGYFLQPSWQILNGQFSEYSLPLGLWSPVFSHSYWYGQCIERRWFQSNELKVSTQKPEADLTDEQRKKGGIHFQKMRTSEECNSKFSRCVGKSM